jgi:hypothetical protein
MGPEPVVATPPRAVSAHEVLKAEVTAPWAGTWINQAQLISGQQHLEHDTARVGNTKRLVQGVESCPGPDPAVLVRTKAGHFGRREPLHPDCRSPHKGVI